MKTKPASLLRAAALAVPLALAVRLAAAPLAAPTPVRTKPDAAAPAIATLPAGAEPFIAVGVPPPAGWIAVALPGPHRVFVRTADLAKDNTVKAGAFYLLTPAADAPALTLAEKGDKTTIRDFAGRFTELSLENRTIVGYIPAPAVSPAAPPVAANPVPPASEPPRDPVPTAPARIPAAPPPADTARQGGATPDGLPQLFQGTLASTRAPLRPRRPYDYELRDTNGNRFAYLDTSRLVAPQQVESYLDRVVVVYGVARAVPNSSDLVIVAENIAGR
jgi:hypothetical protein